MPTVISQDTTSGRRAERTLALVACVIVCFLPGLVGSAFPPGEWYEGLAKPALTPPGWVFPVAWTTLYLMMGVALFLYLDATPTPRPRLPLVAFGLQLVLNGAWSWIFFGLQRPGLALLDLGLLWVAILVSVLGFAGGRRAAAALLVPYLAWVTFAGYLNARIWQLN